MAEYEEHSQLKKLWKGYISLITLRNLQFFQYIGILDKLKLSTILLHLKSCR
jgi:hypothetical protein